MNRSSSAEVGEEGVKNANLAGGVTWKCVYVYVWEQKLIWRTTSRVALEE